MNIALQNDPLFKKKVIKNTFPMRVKLKYETNKSTEPSPNINSNHKSTGSQFKLKFLPTPLTTYQINPTTSVKNEKVQLLLDNVSDSFQEFYQMSNKFKISSEGILLPSQTKLFFETKITNKEYKNFATFPVSDEESMLQSLNFTWHKSSKIKHDSKLFTLDNNCIGFEFKLKHTTGLSLSTDQRLKERPIRELLEQGKMLKNGEEIFIQFGIKPAEFEWWREADKRIKSLPKRIKYTETSKNKLSCPAFDSALRIVIKGESIGRAQMLARGTIMAFKQLNGDNELIETQIKKKKLKRWFSKYVEQRRINVHFFRFKKRMLLTRKEIRNFIKLPERNLQIDFDLGVSERNELKVDKLLTKKDGVLIGHTEEKGKNVDIRIPINNLDMFMQTNIAVGSPRMGKDTFFCNYLIESVNRINAGAFIPDVIDEKGNGRGMCDTIRDSLPTDKIIDLNLGDYFNPIYFGLEDVAGLIGDNGMNVIADNFVKVLDLEDTTDSQELCSLIAKVCKCNIYKMYCCLKSKKYAKELYEEIKNEDELLGLEFYHEFLNTKKDRAIATVRTRLKIILGNPHFKHMIAQEHNKEIDFERWIRERKVVLLRMKKMDIGDVGVKILMYLISMKIFWIKKIIQTDDPTFIVYNEPHQYMSDGLQELNEAMMTESPKYRLGIFYLLHNPSQLPNKLWQIMTSSSINFYLFKNTNYKLYSDLKEQLKPIEIDTAMKTEKYESIFLPFIDGVQLDPLFVKMLPPPNKRMEPYNNSHLTTEHSKQFGRCVKEVRKEIMEIETRMYEEGKSA
ncbi:hypothetical protein [Siminovitchia fordii]|uniref:Uncharacterized protein n=1 Tax=Siminovitchia fordii TaxID=254759 RepID=A0ABQ4KC23_9BACI|nr:hypothetical protein [Siminovitchia fordii]GIN22640.1 hypothetical protein J1TS3_37740 [Siminovitchia fordii]